MRVISGIAKGKKLKLPKGESIRPTQDKVKGAIFNILGDTIIDAKVLDLYSGSGALGIEALSRGASSCTFIDKNVRYIKDNLKIVGFEARVIKTNVRLAIERLSKDNEKFDIVLADPPYKEGLVKNILSWLENSGILNNFGLIVVEHSKRETVDISPHQLKKKTGSRSFISHDRGNWCGDIARFKERRYGDTVISIFKYNPAPSSFKLPRSCRGI